MRAVFCLWLHKKRIISNSFVSSKLNNVIFAARKLVTSPILPIFASQSI